MNLLQLSRLISVFKKAAGKIRSEMTVLWLAAKHPSLKWPLKIYLFLIIAYFLSPIDLIPDFIPVIGYLDDAILLPILIFIAFKLIPADILQDCRNQAAFKQVKLKKKFSYALLIILIWLIALTATIILGIYAYKN